MNTGVKGWETRGAKSGAPTTNVGQIRIVKTRAGKNAGQVSQQGRGGFPCFARVCVLRKGPT